jgi:hypothetical protein
MHGSVEQPLQALESVVLRELRAMTKRVPLEALLRRLSRMVEQVFNKRGDIDPVWLVEDASGKQQIIVSPFIAPTPFAAADYKDRVAAKMREHFTENDIVRYAFASECWTVKDQGKGKTEEQFGLQYAALGYTLQNHPDRQEVVLVEAADDIELLWAFRDIIRPAHGKPYLSKPGAIERPDYVTGRFMNLLASKDHDKALCERPPSPPRRVRRSSELPDDVGTVFVTSVPNAPLQILGRRDPANGELCLGSIMYTPKDKPWPPVECPLPPEIEVVTGPEAEQLILAVHGGLTEQAEAEGLTFEQYIAKRNERGDQRKNECG